MKLTRRSIFGLLAAPFAIFTKTVNGEEKNSWYPDVPQQELIADTSKQKISELHEFLGNLLKQYGNICQSHIRVINAWVDELKKSTPNGTKFRPFKITFLNANNNYNYQIKFSKFGQSSFMCVSHEKLWNIIEHSYVTNDFSIMECNITQLPTGTSVKPWQTREYKGKGNLC